MRKTSKKSLRDFTTSGKRREYLEKLLNVAFPSIGKFVFDEKEVEGRNIENLVGAAQIPMGIAGPLKIESLGERFIPLATTEGALVASVNRGCKTVSLSGEVKAFVENVGMSRGPVFKTDDLAASFQFKQWIEKNFKKIAKVGESTSSHLKLKKVKVRVVGKNVYARFSFYTGDAMGMNMVTIATWAIVRFIENKTKAQCVSLAGNFDVDKKSSWLNFIEGRGKRVHAEVVVKKSVVKDVLKVTPEEICDVVYRKCQLGSIMSGSLGFNSHYANIVAAIFAATGQDLAHVVEGSLGVTTAELEKNGDLYFSVYLPSLQIGTVGGGTGLPTQKEALQVMDVYGSKKVDEFAKIVASVVLAGELSLVASLAEGSLASAHQALGRGKQGK